ncbi:MAG: oxaloacetate decarboxylase [Deltaproteobacteria bacterium]|nr:oxaloacetate decarboxylase [Deltaproteobacteria bacterium]
MKKTTLLRKLIFDEDILVMPGCHDALSARIVEQAGFKAVTIGSFAPSACLLGKPDASLITLTEVITHVRNIVEAVDIPVFADGDTGHGNVSNVIRTTREFEKAGVAGFFLEDQVFPKRCGHTEGKQVIPTEEMVVKIRAAVDTRIDPDLVIMARTDSLAITGIDETINRVNKYSEAGADLIFIEAVTTENEMRKSIREVNAPVMASMIEGGKTPIFTVTELQDIGYSTVVYPLSTMFVSAWAVKELMEELYKTGTTTSFMDKMILFDDFMKLVKLDKLRQTEDFYYKDLGRNTSKF